MTEFDRIFGKEFFIIDSNNLQSVTSDLYGYAIQDNKIIQRDSINNDFAIDGFGTYVWVKVDSENITIFQDNTGAFGLYVYKFNDEFVISNSFIKLVDYLKNSKHITFNKKFADAFMFAGLVSTAYDKTLVNEIQVVPRDYKIIINKTEKNIFFKKLDLEEDTINIDSEEGLAILDGWYEKWVELIRTLKSKTNNITADLSGGFDSRVTAAIWLTSNINLDEITIRSREDIVHDFRVASKISKKFNFKLNENTIKQNSIYFEELDTILNISFYAKLGFNKQFYFKFNRYSEPIYKIGGAGGESIRGYYNYTPEEYIQYIANKTGKYSNELFSAAEEMIRYSCKKIDQKYNIYNEKSYDLAAKSYLNDRNRNHFGRSSVEAYCSNVISLAPLQDNDLIKLITKTEECDDKDLLIALIFLRYCPELLEIEFAGDKKIDENTLYHARKINEKYPYIRKSKKLISCENTETQEKVITEGKPRNVEKPTTILENLFCSKTFEMEFKKYYSNDIYQSIMKYVLNHKGSSPLTHVYSAIAILKIIHATKYKEINKDGNTVEWIKSFFNQEKLNDVPSNFFGHLLKYATARIDMRNKGSEHNSVEIIENDDVNSYESRPKWLSKDTGKGLIINSYKGSLNLKIKCIQKGLLTIRLRGLDTRDKNGKRFPIYIDYITFSVNNVEQVNHKLLCYDKPFTFRKEVEDNEILDVHIEWAPFNRLSDYGQ